MFKRYMAYLLIFLVLSCGLLALFWQQAPVSELYSARQSEEVYRLSQDLSGIWRTYDSPPQAFKEETRISLGQPEPGFFNKLMRKSTVVLPSDASLRVVATQFQVSDRWGARTGQLVLEGLNGKVRVYLNGVKNENLVGEAEGFGGQAVMTVETARLRFDAPNILVMELENTSLAASMPFGEIWPTPARITGRVRLDAVPSTAFALEQLTMTWRSEEKIWVATVGLDFYQFTDVGPWTVTGTLIALDGTEAARASLSIATADAYRDRVELPFSLPNPSFWTPDAPYMYTLKLQLTGSRGEHDAVQMPVGLATVAMTDGAWRLNGENIAVSALMVGEKEDLALRNTNNLDGWLKEQKENGYNLIYFFDSFPYESWFLAADRVGIGLWTSLPLDMPVTAALPAPQLFTSMLHMAARHPTHWAWTGGLEIPNQPRSVAYLNALREETQGKPLYTATLHRNAPAVSGAPSVELRQPINATGVDITTIPAQAGESDLTTSFMPKIAAILWLLLLLFVEFMNLRARHWSFQDLVEKPRRSRAMKESCRWRFYAFCLRMATISGTWLLLIYTLPLDKFGILPYDFTWLENWRRQPFVLLWLCLTGIFTFFRVLQIGVGLRAFQPSLDIMGLLCWLERRYPLFFLAALGWVLVTFGLPWFLPLALYYGLLFLYWPLRARDIRKAGGNNIVLLFLPLTAALIFIIIILSRWMDWRLLGGVFLYLAELLTGRTL